MKITIFTSILLIQFILFSQSENFFNGKVVHSHFYISDSLDSDSLSKVKSKGDIYYFYQNLYQGVTFVGDNHFIYTYNSDSNTCLHYNYLGSGISCKDYSVNTGDTLISSIKDDSTVSYTHLTLPTTSRV